MSNLQTLTTVPDDEVFDDQVDLFLLSTTISVLGVCEFPDIWVLLADRMGGEEEGFTGDNVQSVTSIPMISKGLQKLTGTSQRFNKCLKNGELIEGEDGAKVFLGGEELIGHKYDVGEIDAGQRDVLFSQIDENLVGCYVHEPVFVGDKILGAFSQFECGCVEEAEDSDE